MKTPSTREVAHRLRDFVRSETGHDLAPEVVSGMASILDNAFGHASSGSVQSGFTDHEVTILLADLRGFTAFSATLEAGKVIEILNRCLGKLSEIVFRHQGVIDKFMGDSIMVLFGAPIAREDDVRRALTCAVEMQLAMQGINRQHRANGLPELYMGIGINTGHVLAGNLGSDTYSEYTVIGDEVNLASRIEAFTLRGQVLMSQTTFEAADGFITAGEPMEVLVKGKNKPVALRELLSIPSLGLNVPRQEVRRSHRIEVSLPLTYQVLDGKIVLPEVREGIVRDIGYHGIQLELDGFIPLYTDLVIEFDLPIVGFRASDLYAKVVSLKERDGRFLAGLEFTSVTAEVNMNIQMFTQLLILKR